MNKRDAINEVLMALNELPLQPSDSVEAIPTAILVDREINIAKKKVLSYGWEFNTFTLSFYPNVEGHIVVPSTFLSADGGEDNPQVIIRDWKVYDTERKSFKFDSPIELDVIDDTLFDDIPFSVANYIVQVAALKAYVDIIGNTDDISLRIIEVKEAKMEALRYDARISNTNLLDSDYVNGLLK